MSTTAGPTLPTATATNTHYCYECERHVTISPPLTPTSELFCPNCNGTFLEESETAPPPPNPNPILLSGLETPLDDIETIFNTHDATHSSSDEFNPFAFLNNYITNLQSRGASIQLVFESPTGGALEFDNNRNLGDYFMGPGLEQLIQQLAENDPNRYGTPPASKTAIEAMPDVKISKEILESDSSQCAVCKDSFEIDESVKQMPCKHMYHKDCILPWLEMHNSCPVCRYELPTDDQDYERTVGLGGVIGSGGSEEGGREGGGNGSSSVQSPGVVERRFRISVPWLFRGGGGNGGGSSSGGGGEGEGGSEDMDLD